MSHARIRRYLRHGMMPQLAVFEASVRLGSFTRAAGELHLAQPTVSTHIRKLTEAVGQPLFEQVGKRMHVTSAGRVLFEGCRDILSTLTRVDEMFAELKGLHCGRLRLAAGTAAECLSMRLLAGFVERYPDIDVALEIRNHAGLLARLAANEDDLYVFANPPMNREIVRQAILPNSLVPIARADHPLSHARSITFERFAQEPFLMREAGSATRKIASDLFVENGLKPRIRMELSTNEAIAQATLAGLGVSIVSRHTYGLKAEWSGLVELDVEGFPLERPWQFVYPVGKQLPPAARAFMDFAREEACRLVELRQKGPIPSPREAGRGGAGGSLDLASERLQPRSFKACDTGSAASCSRRTGTARAR